MKRQLKISPFEIFVSSRIEEKGELGLDYLLLFVFPLTNHLYSIPMLRNSTFSKEIILLIQNNNKIHINIKLKVSKPLHDDTYYPD